LRGVNYFCRAADLIVAAHKWPVGDQTGVVARSTTTERGPPWFLARRDIGKRRALAIARQQAKSWELKVATSV
jgi:hypothetical protein